MYRNGHISFLLCSYPKGKHCFSLPVSSRKNQRKEQKKILLSIYFIEINSQKQSNLSLTLCEQTHLEISQLKIEYLYKGISLYLSNVFRCELSKKILPRELTHPVLPEISDIFLFPF